MYDSEVDITCWCSVGMSNGMSPTNQSRLSFRKFCFYQFTRTRCHSLPRSHCGRRDPFKFYNSKKLNLELRDPQVFSTDISRLSLPIPKKQNKQEKTKTNTGKKKKPHRWTAPPSRKKSRPRPIGAPGRAPPRSTAAEAPSAHCRPSAPGAAAPAVEAGAGLSTGCFF